MDSWWAVNLTDSYIVTHVKVTTRNFGSGTEGGEEADFIFTIIVGQPRIWIRQCVSVCLDRNRTL